MEVAHPRCHRAPPRPANDPLGDGHLRREHWRDLPIASIIWGTGNEENWTSLLFAKASNLPVPGLCATCTTFDPLFVDPAAGDFRLQASSPVIDLGGALLATESLHDLDLDPRELDGDGLALLDMGYDEWNPAHLAVVGTPALGQSVTFTTTGPLGAQYLLGLATSPAEVNAPPHGTLLIPPAAYLTAGQGFTPSSDTLAVPVETAFVGLEVYLQAYTWSPTTTALSNQVELVVGP